MATGIALSAEISAPMSLMKPNIISTFTLDSMDFYSLKQLKVVD